MEPDFDHQKWSRELQVSFLTCHHEIACSTLKHVSKLHQVTQVCIRFDIVP